MSLLRWIDSFLPRSETQSPSPVLTVVPTPEPAPEPQRRSEPSIGILPLDLTNLYPPTPDIPRSGCWCCGLRGVRFQWCPKCGGVLPAEVADVEQVAAA